MEDNDAGVPPSAATLPKWQMILPIFVGVVIANNLVLYGIAGGNRAIFDPAKRLGYEMGTGIGLGLGLTLMMWLMILRKAPRKWTLACLVIISLSATLAMHYIPLRPSV